ncbi:MAG: D-alanyl-D-alanine carboxypeptidase family protein [Anaerovoracaceae bacterium]|jgi:D-alanyl-D-alanine carboxypeptidase (penicillin-binding protein 5/6)
MRKRLTAIVLSIVLLMPAAFTYTASAAVTTIPETGAQSAVLIDANTGEVLFDKSMDMTEYPASTTKIMTALLAIENLPLDEVVTVGVDATQVEGSNLELKAGEQLTVEQLLYGMMLKSANDMAVALADAVAGSVEDFAVLMNERAEEIGCTNTHFVTPNGLPNDQHVTTAHDLALIASEAMKNEEFAKIVKTKTYTIPATNMSEARKVTNSNQLLTGDGTVTVDGVERSYYYEGIKGIKTGYTNAAQACLVADAERDGLDLISVTMHSTREDQYPDAIKILDWGFANFEALTIVHKNQAVAASTVKEGTMDKVSLVPEEDLTMTVEKTDTGTTYTKDDFTYETKSEELTAPVKEGTEAGEITIYRDGQEMATYKLVTQNSVDQSFLYKALSYIENIWNKITN